MARREPPGKLGRQPMCNEVRRRIALGQIRDDFQQLRIPLVFPEGLPNLAPLDSIRITDPTAIIRAATDGEGAEMVTRRWSWPGAGGKPVYNYRADGRRLTTGRCLVPVDGFYEFTEPERAEGAPKPKRKDKWVFTHADEAWFALAGIWRADAGVGEAFALLTCPPGPDVAPYHTRQVAVVARARWTDWLDPAVPSETLIGPLPAGTLAVARV